MEIGKIYNENCLITMSNLADNCIDFVITSPPYDDIRNYNGYQFELEKIVKELFRVIKNGGVVIWVVADATIDGSETGTSFKQALLFKEIGFRLHDTMIYYKNNPMPQTGNRYHQHFEYMFAFSKGSPSTFNPITEPTKYKGLANMKNRGQDGLLNYEKVERTTEKKVGNVFFYSVGGGISTKDKIAYNHPAIFPEKLVADQINTWTNENDLVYDPFMGSGTTAKIAQLLNRNWIGSEISKEYVDIANERLIFYTNNLFRENSMNSIERGSKTAKDGFKNEDDIVNKFNNWINDNDAQLWLIIMNYNLSEIEYVKAVKISGYKTDVQVQVTIKLKKAIDVENLQVKLVSNLKGFNQIDKRWVDKYSEMWNIPSSIVSILKRYTGEEKPTKMEPRDKRRMFANEFSEFEQKSILNWLKNNQSLIVSDILKGQGKFAAEWMLVAQKISKNARWVLKPMNFCMNFFGNGNIEITKRGTFKIGRITMQRKGGDGGRKTANELQFKINPAELFDII